jgi:hypothetical protein
MNAGTSLQNPQFKTKVARKPGDQKIPCNLSARRPLPATSRPQSFHVGRSIYCSARRIKLMAKHLSLVKSRNDAGIPHLLQVFSPTALSNWSTKIQRNRINDLPPIQDKNLQGFASSSSKNMGLIATEGVQPQLSLWNLKRKGVGHPKSALPSLNMGKVHQSPRSDTI